MVHNLGAIDTGHSQRHIASGTGLSRDTVAKYIAAAEGLDVSREGPEPSEDQTQPAGGHRPAPAGVLGERRGGKDGTGWELQRRNLDCLPDAIEGEALRASEGNFGQCPGAPWRGGAGISQYTRIWACSYLTLPGYSPNFNADEANCGLLGEEATGSLCLGSKAQIKGRVGDLFSSLASRKERMKRRCYTILQSTVEALLRDSQPDSQHTGTVHPTSIVI